MGKLCDKNICTGCSACLSVCSNHAITMQADSEGFLIPVIDADACTDCGLCEKACPQMAPAEKHSAPAVYASWNTSDAIRCASSSGGLFFTFARKIIEQQGVVFGAVLSEGGMSVSHRYAENLEGLKPMMGSKYVQSDLGDSFRQVSDFLKSGRKVLFTGTPCQVSGLYGFLGKRNTDNLFTVDVICHGVPSASFLRFYLDDAGVKAGLKKAGTMTFRDSTSWPGCFTGPMKEYVSLFLSGRFMRESCYSCNYTTVCRVSDITIGDFWGIGETIPFEGDTSKGCSVVLVNSEKGSSLLDAVRNDLFIRERQIEEALVRNTQLHSSTKRDSKRDFSYKYIQKHSLARAILHFEDASSSRRFRHYVKIAIRNLTSRH